MFGRMVTAWRARRALVELQKNPIYRAAIRAIRGTLADTSKGLGKQASQTFKEHLAERAIREVGEVLSCADPVLANREKLAIYVLEMAKYGVLILPPPAEPDVSGLRGKPGITGELRSHLLAVADRDHDIKELAWSQGATTYESVFAACNFMHAVAWFMTDVFHHVRIALGDHHPSDDKDWYRPYVEAMFAWQEYLYREAIGLPDVLASRDSYGTMAALKYSTFMNIVMSGAKYPNFEWEEHYKSR